MLPRIHHRLLLPQGAAAFLLGTAVSCTVTNHTTQAPDPTPAETDASLVQTPERISFQTMVPTPPLSPTAYTAQMENLLRNPGFETDFANWNREPDPPGADTEIDTEIAHSGSRSLRIDFDGSADVDYWHVGQDVSVEPDTAYRLLAHLRSRGIEAYQSVSLTVTDGRGWEYLGYSTADLYGTQDWTPVSTIEFTTLPDTKILRVAAGRGGMGGRFPISGTVWIDDVALVRLPVFLSPSTATLGVGDEQTLTAANGKSPYRWSSGNPLVAAVRNDGNDREGIVTALSAGDSEITAVDAEGKTARAAVHVLAGSAIAVYADRILREVPQAMFGSNVNYFDTAAGGRPAFGDVIRDPAFIADVAELGLTSLRFPGGTFSNYYDFSIEKGYVDWAGGTGQFNFSGITTDQFLRFLRDTGIPDGMITANIYKSGYKYWPGDNWISPQVAADWLEYVNRKSGFRIGHWELGNEVDSSDSFPWETDPQVPGLTREMYLEKVSEWSRAMKAVDPSAKIGAVAVLPGRGGGKAEWWDLPLIHERSGDFDFLIVHPYVRVNPYMVDGSYADSTAAGVFAWIWATHPVADLRRQLETFAPDRAAGIEIQASEWAVIAFPELPETHTDTLLDSVLSTDMFWDMVGEGLDGANYYSLCSYYFETLEPISGGNKHAQYHAMWMNRRRSGKWLLEAAVSSPTYSAGPLGGDEYEKKTFGSVDGVPYLSAYATLSEDGRRLYLIVTNKSAEAQTTTITLNGFNPLNRASVWQMTSMGWDDTGIQPATFEISDAGPAFSFAFPARSVTSFLFNL